MPATLVPRDYDKSHHTIVGEEVIWSANPRFFFEVIRCASPYLIRGASLDITASEIPIPANIEKVPSHNDDNMIGTFVESGVDVNKYSKLCEAIGVLPFSSIDVRYDWVSSIGMKFVPAGSLKFNYDLGDLVFRGGKPHFVRLYFNQWSINCNTSNPQTLQGRYNLFLSSLDSFLSSNKYSIHDGSLSFDDGNYFIARERIDAFLSTRGQHRKLRFSAGDDNHINEDTAKELSNWLSKVRTVA